MLKTDQDVVEWARQLAESLINTEHGEWGLAIEEALRSKDWVELLGKLRFELYKFDASDVPEKLGFHEEIQTALEMLDKALA